jgi:tripartite-type tricarboxylate transporter receptor subunit TctC
MIHVSYRGGGQVMTDLIAGQVQVSFIGLSVAIEHIRSGKLRALAVTAATRSEVLPDFPTVGDFVPGYEASAFWGIGAPRNTPGEIVDKLNKEINASLSDPQLSRRLAEGGGTAFAGSPAEFGNFIAKDIEKWGKVVKFAGLKPD